MRYLSIRYQYFNKLGQSSGPALTSYYLRSISYCGNVAITLAAPRLRPARRRAPTHCTQTTRQTIFSGKRSRRHREPAALSQRKYTNQASLIRKSIYTYLRAPVFCAIPVRPTVSQVHWTPSTRGLSVILRRVDVRRDYTVASRTCQILLIMFGFRSMYHDTD